MARTSEIAKIQTDGGVKAKLARRNGICIPLHRFIARDPESILLTRRNHSHIALSHSRG
jgi:hypothetical protein